MDVDIEWPWQYSFPPFFTLQLHAETRRKQISAWKTLILAYCKAAKLSVIDIRESSNLSLFNNTSLDRKLDASTISVILNELQCSANAAPIDKQKNTWEIYWHTLNEWGVIIYNYVESKGALNTVFTVYELTQGEDVQGEEFYGLDVAVLLKALRTLEVQGKCEVMEFDNQQGVKFF